MKVVQQVLDIFQHYRMRPTSIDQYEQVGREVLGNKISSFISNGERIEFVMLGYPMKSPNERDKVIGSIPDLGEQLSVENFKNFSDAVSTVYPHGISINLVSDGYVFSDIMKTSDITVAGYEEVMKDMIRIAPIKWYNAKDFYSNKLSVNNVREKIVQQFGVTPLILEQRILTDPDVNFLYRGMIKFLEVDLAAYPYSSSNSLHKDAKRVAREMMFRNEAYSQLIREEFKDCIRLSMHPSINNGTKYSFQLIPSPKAWTSPWHSAIAMDPYIEGNERYETIHRKDAVAGKYQLEFKNGKPYYFTKILTS